MSWPLDLEVWVDRLKAAGITELKHIGLAGDLEMARDVSRSLPGVWLMPADDTATASAVSPVRNGRRQITSRVAVGIGLRAYGDAAGGVAAKQLQPIRKAVAEALKGWQPEPNTTAVVFSGGSIAAADDDISWWIDTYEVTGYE